MAEPLAAGGGLARLRDKYEALGELRRARAAGEPIPEKSVFRALASEFPGALHELDRLPLTDIDARRDAIAGALAGGPIAPWMLAMVAYHALYRAALHVKLRARKRADVSPADAEALALAASRHASIDVSAAFVRAVARPEGGRIGPIVMAEAAARVGLRAAEIGRELFPLRRDLAIMGKTRDDDEDQET